MQIDTPKRGLTTEDAIIVEWNDHEGDSVEKDLVVAVLETQKVEWKMEAEGSGRLDTILTVGTKAAVSNVSGIHAESKEKLKKVARSQPPAPAPVGKGEAAAPAMTTAADRKGADASRRPQQSEDIGEARPDSCMADKASGQAIAVDGGYSMF